MATLQELLAQKAALENQIAQTRKQELSDAINQVKALVAAHGLSADDVFGGARKAKAESKKGSKVAAKYRDPISGKTWSGRGLAPKWLDGKNKADYLIA
jgi:DNA-binding protein H-NS